METARETHAWRLQALGARLASNGLELPIGRSEGMMNWKFMVVLVASTLVLASVQSQAACTGHTNVSTTRQAALFSLLHASNVPATAFKVYDETTSANGKLDYVIYSEATALQDSDDQQFAARLALLTGTGAKQTVADKADITALMASSDPAQPGEFAAILGCATAFLLPSSVQTVAVNAWSVLSGNGTDCSGSDVVYRIDSNNHLVLAFTLPTSNKFLRLGPARSVTIDSSVYLIPAADGTIGQIIDEERSHDTSPGSDPPYTQIFELYTWNGTLFADSGRLEDATATAKISRAVHAVRDDGIPSVVIPAGVVPG